MIEELKTIEMKLDIINGELGTKEYYCIYCKSKKYNGEVGIIHNPFCPILELRWLIKNIQGGKN